MGSSASTLAVEGAASVIAAIGLALLFRYSGSSSTEPAQRAVTDGPKPAKGKKGNKKRAAQNTAPLATTSPSNIPGGSDLFSPPSEPDIPDEDASTIAASFEAAKTAKEKRKKVKRATSGSAAATNVSTAPNHKTAPSATAKLTQRSPIPVPPYSGVDSDQWTKVERTRKSSTLNSNAEVSVTGSTNEPETASSSSDHGQKAASEKRTLAEKLTPKVRKTAVDDMQEESTQPSLARVMRIVPGEVESTSSKGVIDALDSEDDFGGQSGAGGITGTDDEGFIAVVSKGRRRPQRTASTQSIGSSQSATRSSETMTKKQRQNLAKRESEKSIKAANEEDRQERLSQHRRDQEKARIHEMYKSQGKGKSVSGGMTMSVNDDGKAIWD